MRTGADAGSWRRLRNLFGREPVAGVNPVDLDRLRCVLCLRQASSRAHRNGPDRTAPAVREVLHAAIGIGLPGGGFQPVLKRNTPLPCSGKPRASPQRGTTRPAFDLVVLQGDSDRALDNDLLGMARLGDSSRRCLAVASRSR